MRNPRLRCCSYLLCFVLTATIARAGSVGTLPATVINTNTVVLNGVADPGGESYSGYFEYGLTTNYGTSTVQQPLGNGTRDTNFNQPVTGLTPGLTYHCRASIKDLFGTGTGNDQSFLMPRAPVANTAAATLIHPGQNVGMGKDFTLFATTAGTVKYERQGRDRKRISVYPAA